MTREAYERVRGLFLKAIELPPEKRGEYLEQACGGDANLRAYVESLIHNDEAGILFGNEKDPPPQTIADPKESLSGLTLSRYRIIGKIGEGGMATVYRAEDTTLDRIVALKFLSPQVARHPESMKRFVREAKAAAAIDHPNVCPVFEICADGPRAFISMAYLEGRVLSDRLAGGPLEIEAAIDIAIQTCRGLEAAHAKGILHRDIKPPNLMVSEVTSTQRLVRILDFGVARLSEQPGLTHAGVTIGTVSYMAPEQIEHSDIDGRVDLWALGVVLYQMISGELPFHRETTRETLAAITASDPEPLSKKRAGLPPFLETVVNKALQKNPAKRYQTAGEFLTDLEKLQEALRTSEQTARLHRENEERRARERARLIWAAVGAAVIGVALFVIASRSGTDAPAVVATPQPFTSYLGAEGEPAISPDGTRIAFTWNGESETGEPDIYVQLIGSTSPLRLTDTPYGEFHPVWSPDGAHIAFLRHVEYRSSIVVVPALGGPERVVAPLDGEEVVYGSLDWSPTSDLFATDEDSAIVVFSPAGEGKKQLTFPKPGDLDLFARFDPSGERVSFVRIYADAPSELLAVPVAGGEPEVLVSGGMVTNEYCWNRDGSGLVYVGHKTESGGPLTELSLPGGTPKPLRLDVQNAATPFVRGNRLAYARRRFSANIWASDVTAPANGGPRDGATMLISSSQRDHSPQFSADGESIVFSSDRSGSVQIWRSDRDGRNLFQLTSVEGRSVGTPRWSPDGRWIAVDGTIDSVRPDIYVINAITGAIRRVTRGDASDILPSWSRDGAWIYYCSNAGGPDDIWKIPAEGGDPVQVTRDGGWEAFESLDGKFLYYSKPTGPKTIHRLDLATGEEQALSELGDAGAKRYWALTENGIFFVNTFDDPHWLQFYEFTSGRISKVRPIADIISYGPAGLAASPDGRTVLYVQQDIDDQDIMLVEGLK